MKKIPRNITAMNVLLNKKNVLIELQCLKSVGIDRGWSGNLSTMLPTWRSVGVRSGEEDRRVKSRATQLAARGSNPDLLNAAAGQGCSSRIWYSYSNTFEYLI